MQPLLIAALPIVGVLVGAALQYVFGRSLEGRKLLAAQRAQAYIDYFRAVAVLAQGRSKEQLSLAADAKARICLYGSNLVIERLAAFERTGAALTNDQGRDAILTLMQVMRRDVGYVGIQLATPDLDRVLFGDPATRTVDAMRKP